MSQLSQRSLLQKLQGWSDERCKDDFEDIMPKLLREIVEASPEGTVELCSLLHKRFLCHALIDELGQKIMNTVSSELGNVFFKAIEKLPGCHRDVSTMTLATVTEGLKYSVEVLKCYDEFIRQVVSLVKESAAAIELPSMYEFSSCTIEILNKSYTHCKSSEKNYGEIFRQTSGILGLLFQKTYSMQKSFGFILANIKQTTEFVISDENKKSVEKISQGLLTVCETTCSIDNTLLASTWNIMIRFIKEFKDVVQEKINPNPYVSLLSENIIQCVSYSIQLHDKSFHLLTSGDEATKKALNQSSKYSKVLLSILLDMVKVFHVKLNNRSVCILMSFFHKFHHLFKLEESINCSVHTKIQFRCNFIKQLVQYQSIIRLLLSSSCFLPYFHVFSLEAGEFHYGWLHVWLSINNELVTSETVLFQWCLNPGDARSPAVLLVNFIIDCVSSINNVAHSHLNNGNALYETALIHVCALISQLPKDVFTNVENSMFHFLSSYNPVKSLFAGDVFAFLARSSPAIASHYKSVFCKMLCCVVDIEKIVFPLHLLISLLNRIGASLEDIQKMSSKSLNMFPKWSIVLKQSGDINISPRKICNDILNVVKRPKISLGDMHGLSANLSLLALCFKNSSIIRKEKALLKSAISSTLNIFEDFGSLDNLCLSITYNCFISRFLDALKHFMPLADEFEKTKALQCFQVMLTNNIAMPAQLQVAGILCELVDVSSENLGTMSNIFHKLITSHNWLVSHSSVVSLINVTQSANGTNLLEKCVTSSEISEIMEAYFAVDTEKADLYHLPLLKPGTDSMTEVVKYFQSWQDKASKQSECFIAKRTDPGNSSSLSQRISHIEDEMLLLSHSISDTVRSKVVDDICMPMKPAFNFQLNHKVYPHTVTVGKYDGEHPCLTAATTAGKVIIHSPYSKISGGDRITEEAGGVSLLNINQAITSLCAGQIQGEEKRDVLAVGTATNLLLYDDVPDGVNALQIGKLGDIESPLVIAGGNCTLQGFDFNGEDKYWTVTGDNVCSLALVDFGNNGKNKLIVGSEDFDIRVFQEDEIISEMSENDVVTGLSPIDGSKFGYSLANGTIGVYNRTARYWRVKSKSQVTAMHYFDINGDGMPELITGWSNGKIDARNPKTGDIMYKDSMSSAIAGIVDAEYRMDGKRQLICVSVDGDVKGYDAIVGKAAESALDSDKAQDELRELNQRKQGLLLEMQNYQQEKVSEKSSALLSSSEKTMAGMIPTNTELKTKFLIAREDESTVAHIKLLISTSDEDVVVRMVTVFGEGIFDGESMVVHPAASQTSSSIEVPLLPIKDAQVELHIKAYIGPRNSQSFHVYELTRTLPKFCMYSYVSTTLPKSISSVSFTLNDRLQRILLWLNESFLLLDNDGDVININVADESKDFNISFLLLRGGGSVVINFAVGGVVTIHTDDIDVAGDMIQSMASFLGISDLQVTAEFPGHFEQLHELIDKAGELHTTQQRLSAEMSDHSNLIRSLVVRAEDSRLMSDHSNMKQSYSELYSLNQDLVNGYHIRCNNHNDLLECLRLINKGIQRAANLRVGRHKTNLVSACREAVKKNDATTLVRVMKAGSG